MEKEKVIDPEIEQIKSKLIGFGSFLVTALLLGMTGAGGYSFLGAFIVSIGIAVYLVYQKGKKA